MTMKKITFLIITMLLPLIAMADAVEIDGIYYNLITKENVAEVTQKPSKYSGNVTIPSSISYGGVDYSVMAIGTNSFYECTNLKSVTIPNSVTSIGNKAFYKCGALTSVTISNNLKSISDWAFYGCSVLTSITIPKSTTYIGSAAFYGCSGLTTITIPHSVKGIEENAFSNCNLSEIIVEEGGIYDSRNNCNAIIIKSTDKLIVGCKNTTIPNSVTTIGHHAFEGCSGLTSITIPNSVTSIEKFAFFGSGLTSITIPSSVTTMGYAAFSGCKALTSVKIPSSVTTIEGSTFYGCTGLTSIIIPDGVTRIEDEAFEACYSLTSVTIPNNMLSIGVSAFSRCDALTDIYCYAEEIPSLGTNSFDNPNDILHVPAVSLDAYKSSCSYLFKEIVALTDSDPKPTGIKELKCDSHSDGLYFDLQGRQMSMPHKGVNIVNGKKILVK